MGKETERKFLVEGEEFKKLAEPVLYHQGFLSTHPERVVRVRQAGDKAFLSVKGLTTGFTRMEFEYEIPPEDAAYMIEHLCAKPAIKKFRYRIKHGDHIWEVDEFLEDNKGLTIAEVELQNEEEEFLKPGWVGKEVTGDPRYYNASLAENPYRNWKVNI